MKPREPMSWGRWRKSRQEPSGVPHLGLSKDDTMQRRNRMAMSNPQEEEEEQGEEGGEEKPAFSKENLQRGPSLPILSPVIKKLN